MMAASRGTECNQTPNVGRQSAAVSPRVIRSADKRETAQTISLGPQVHAKWKRKWRRADS